MAAPHPLLTAPIGPTLAKLAAPSILAMAMTMATSMTEAWFVGQLGTVALASLALGFPMFMLNMMLSAGAFGGAITGLVARHLGANDRAGAEAVAFHGLILALVFAAISSTVFLLFGRPIFTALGGEGAVLETTLSYTAILFGGVVSVWVFNTLASVIRGTGRMQLAALWMILVSVIQIVASGLLVLGPGPFPALGLPGAAIGVILAFTLGSIGQLIYLTRNDIGVGLRFTGIPLQGRIFSPILRIGGLASLSAFSTIGTTIIVTGFAARLGTAALAGYGIGSRLELLMIPLVFGIGTACTAMIGVAFGANDVARAHRIGWTGGFAAAAITGMIGLVAALFPGLWANLFTDNEEVREACRIYLSYVGPTYAFFGLGLCLYFASQGAGRMLWPSIGNLARFGFVFVAGLVIYAGEEATVTELYLAVGAGMVIYGLVIAGSIRLGAWTGRLSLSRAA